MDSLFCSFNLRILNRLAAAFIFFGLVMAGLSSSVPALSGNKWVAEYRVASGDTLQKISEKYLGDPDRYLEIASMNELKPPFVLTPGMRILIPGLSGQISGEKVSEKKGGTVHIVRSRDTLESLSEKFLGSSDLYPLIASVNSMKQPFILVPGQKIIIPEIRKSAVGSLASKGHAAVSEIPDTDLSDKQRSTDKPEPPAVVANNVTAAVGDEAAAPVDSGVAGQAPADGSEASALAAVHSRNVIRMRNAEAYQKVWKVYGEYISSLFGIVGYVTMELNNEAEAYAIVRQGAEVSDNAVSEPVSDSVSANAVDTVAADPASGPEAVQSIQADLITGEALPPVSNIIASSHVFDSTSEVSDATAAVHTAEAEVAADMKVHGTTAEAGGPSKRKKVRTVITILLLLILLYWIIRLYDAYVTEQRRKKMNRL